VRAVPPSSAIVLAEPATSNRAARIAMDILSHMFPGAEHLSAADFPQTLARMADEQRILIIPELSRLPMQAWTPLRDYLDAGGAAVFLGCDPFRARVCMVDGKPQTEQRLKQDLLASARVVDGFSSLLAWQHLNDSGAMRGAVRLAAADQTLPWPGVSVEIRGLTRWDALVLDTIPKGTIREEENTLAFHARGDDRTAQLVVICEERNVGAWYATAPLTSDWQVHTLHAATFRAVGRARPDATFSLARVKKISIGLFVAVSPQEPGDHRFDISEVRLAADPRPPAEATTWPDIPLMSPPCRYYDLRAPEVRPEGADDRFYLGHTRMQSPYPTERGWGGEKGSPARWIPVYTAFSENQRVGGWPASLFIEPRTNGPARRWAWIGMDPDSTARELIEEMVSECVSRLYSGLFLYQAGCDRFTIDPDDTLDVSARWTTNPKYAATLRVAAELIREGESYPARRIVMAPSQPGGPATIHLGRVPDMADGPGNYLIRVSIEDAEESDRVYDFIEQPIKILPATDSSMQGPWISTSGARFTLGGRPLFLLGFSYAPPGLESASPKRMSRWLSPACFDPEQVRRDLAIIEGIGVNTIAIAYHDEDEAPQLRFFLDEATRRGLWVYLALEDLDPMAPDVGKLRRMLDAAGLKDQSRVWAMAVATDARVGRYAERCRFDEAWHSWLLEQYGSVEHAEEVIGRPLWRAGRKITGPSDMELSVDGDYRGAVAVYRRFVDDYASRQLGRVVRTIRDAGCRQLVTLQTGFLGTGSAAGNAYLPLDSSAGAAHFDFAAIQGNELHGATDDFNAAGFLTAYARGMLDGKPVAWLRFGAPVGNPPAPAGLKNQARVCDEMFNLALRSYSASCIGWRYTPGECPEERGDYGVVSPDGEPRPAAETYREFAHRLRIERDVPATWQGREVHRDADARGLSALWNQWKKDYADATAARRLIEVRRAGFGRRTSEVLLRPVGGEAYQAPAAIEGINAEWGRVEVDGKPVDRVPGEPIRVTARQLVRLELINTGSITWDAAQENQPRTVWVALQNPRGGVQLLPVKAARFGEKVWITVTVTDLGHWHLRPQLADAGPFGEAAEIDVAGDADVLP